MGMLNIAGMFHLRGTGLDPIKNSVSPHIYHWFGQEIPWFDIFTMICHIHFPKYCWSVWRKNDGFQKWRYPKFAGWFVRENPFINEWFWGYPHLGKHAYIRNRSLLYSLFTVIVPWYMSLYHLRVFINGGTPKSSIYEGIFPSKPSSCGGTRILGNPHMIRIVLKNPDKSFINPHK